MSYILEALKRSEQERNQNDLPNFRQENSLLYIKKEGKPWWPFALVIVLGLNALVFLYIHLSGPVKSVSHSEGVNLSSSVNGVDNGTGTVHSKQGVMQGQALDLRQKIDQNDIDQAALRSVSSYSKQVVEQNNSADANSVSALPAVPATSQGKPLSQPVVLKKTDAQAPLQAKAVNSAIGQADSEREQGFDDAASQGYVELKTNTSARVVVANEPFDEPEVGGANAPKPITQSEYKDTPFLFNLPEQSRPNVPKLVFNSHIYSDEPSARRVMINNIYLREGQVFSGLEVLEIGELDVVFEKSGTQFKLPAMRDWRG
jgi:general secretion pathway protein B